MAVAFAEAVPREDRWAPRVTGALTLVPGASGEAEQADIDPVDLSNEQVVLYSSSTGRFYSSGVEESELEVLNGLFHGIATANKALVAGSDKSISQLKNVSADLFSGRRVFVTADAGSYLQSHGPVTFRDDAGSFVVESAVDTELRGVIKSDLRLYYNQSLQLGYTAGTFRDVIRRQASSNTLVLIGNSSDRLKFETNSNNLVHGRGGTDYVIWTAHNHGPGSGLNADMLDGIQGSNYLRADVFNSVVRGTQFLREDSMDNDVFHDTQLDTAISEIDTHWYKRFGLDSIQSLNSITSIDNTANFNVSADTAVVQINESSMAFDIEFVQFHLMSAGDTDYINRVVQFDVIELSSPGTSSPTTHEFRIYSDDNTLIYSRSMTYQDTLTGSVAVMCIGPDKWVVLYDNLVES